MSKSLRVFVCVCCFFGADATRADVNQGQALAIDIGGIGPGVDQKAYRQVRNLIGNAIAKGTIDKFLIHGYGKEGGFSGCVQTGMFSDHNAFQRLSKSLQSVRYNKNTTAYQVSEIDSCSEQSAITVFSVFKSDDGQQCQENAVALETHQKELEDHGIVVSRPRKQSDGKFYPSVCGAPEGMRNVFDIAVKDLEAAVKLGFSLLVDDEVAE